MPLGLNRTDLNSSNTSYKNGFPITTPHSYGTSVTLPHTFGNALSLPVTYGNAVTWTVSPTHFGNTLT